MSKIQMSEQDVVALALQFSAQAISSQTLYMGRLSHFDSVIGEAIRLKQQIMLDMRAEQVKQSSFSLVNKLIGENIQLQKKITTLEHALVTSANQVYDLKKLNSRLVTLEEELNMQIQKSEDIKSLEGIVGALRYQIKELMVEKGKTQEEVSIDEDGVLARERNQLGMLRRAVYNKSEQFDAGWQVVKMLIGSMERRGKVQDQTMQCLFEITRREIQPALQYVQSIRTLNGEQQQLLSNCQKQILEYQSTNKSWQRQMAVITTKLKQEQRRSLHQARLVEEGSLRESQTKIKIEVLQSRLREVTNNCLEFQSQKLVRETNNTELVEGLSSLKQQNHRVMEQLYLVKEERTKMSEEIAVLREENSMLTCKLEKVDRIQEKHSTEHQAAKPQAVQIKQKDHRKNPVDQLIQQQIQPHALNYDTSDKQVAQSKRLNESIRAENQHIQGLHNRQIGRHTILSRPDQSRTQEDDKQKEDPTVESLTNLNQLIRLVTFYY